MSWSKDEVIAYEQIVAETKLIQHLHGGKEGWWKGKHNSGTCKICIAFYQKSTP